MRQRCILGASHADPFVRTGDAARRGDRHVQRTNERLFDAASAVAGDHSRAGDAAHIPAMDVSENDTAYTVRFDVPGVSREQLKLSIEGRRIVSSIDAASDAGEAAGARVLNANGAPRATVAPSCCQPQSIRPPPRPASKTACSR